MKCMWDTRRIKYHKFNVSNCQSCSQVISLAQTSSNSRNDLQDVMAVTRDLLASFVSKKYATEAASCLAFSWVFQNEILMEIG